MFDVFLLLSVSWRFFESLDNERRGGWDDGDSCLTVLDGESDGDSETFLHATD